MSIQTGTTDPLKISSLPLSPLVYSKTETEGIRLLFVCALVGWEKEVRQGIRDRAYMDARLSKQFNKPLTLAALAAEAEEYLASKYHISKKKQNAVVMRAIRKGKNPQKRN